LKELWENSTGRFNRIAADILADIDTSIAKVREKFWLTAINIQVVV